MKKLAFNQTITTRIRLIINFALTTFLFAFLLSACSKSDIPENVLSSDINSIEGSENLGSGYDVFENYAEVVYVKAPILDLSKLNADGLIEQKKVESGIFSTCSGTTIEEYCSSLSVSVGLEVKYMYFSGAVETNFNESRYSQETYSFATVKSLIEKTQLRLPLDMTGEDFKPYLTDKARNNLNDPSISPDFIFRTYGTHCLTGVILGGRLDFSISAKTSDLSSSKSIGVYAEASFGKRGVSVTGNTEVISESEYNTFMNSCEERLKIYGGLAENGQDIVNKDEYDSWIASVDDNTVFCNFTQNGLMPVWEFCNDPARKDELIAAFDTWAKDREIIVNSIPRKCILNVRVEEGKFAADSFIEDGVEYFRIKSDLNVNCGPGTPFIWIYYALGYDNDINFVPISEICTIDETDGETLEQLPGDGWEKDSLNVNDGTGGHKIYLAFRRKNNADDKLLTGLKVRFNENEDTSQFSEGTDNNNNWTAVTEGYDGNIKEDLNEGTRDGYRVYLFYTRDQLITE